MLAFLASGDDQEFVDLQPNHQFQQQDPSLITAKNNLTLNILTLNLQVSEVSTPSVSNTFPARWLRCE